MKFVLHLHDKLDWLSLRHSCSHGFHARSENKDTHLLLAPDYTVCNFISDQSSFSIYMKCHTRMRISFVLKTGMNSFRNDLYGNEILSRYQVNRYGEIYGDGMNLFQMKVIPVLCKYPLRLLAVPFQSVEQES